jgi:hypothetical protein
MGTKKRRVLPSDSTHNWKPLEKLQDLKGGELIRYKSHREECIMRLPIAYDSREQEYETKMWVKRWFDSKEGKMYVNLEIH